MKKKRIPLSLPRIVLALAVSWAMLILGVALAIIAWRLTLSPALTIADMIVPIAEAQNE